MDKYYFDYSQYYKKLNHKKSFGFLHLFLLTIFLMSIIVFFKPQMMDIKSTFYFIQIEEFQTYKSALNYSKKVEPTLGPTYIFFDSKYHILLNFYSNKSEAKSRLKPIKKLFQNTKIFKLNFNKKNQTNTTKKLKNLNISLFNSLLKIKAIQTDFVLEKISFNKAIQHLTKIELNISNLFDEFILFSKTNPSLNAFKTSIQSYLNNIKNLTSLSADDMRYHFQYHTLKAAINYYHFSSLF